MLPLYAKDTDRQHRLCDDNCQNKITQTFQAALFHGKYQ